MDVDTLPILEVAKPITKENFLTCCEIVTDIILTTTNCLSEMENEAQPFDKELSVLCNRAKLELDKVVAHIISRVR
jgi:hypothetical protein